MDKPKPMPEVEYQKKLKALPPKAQQQHKNFMALMEAASRKDSAEIKQLLQKFRKQSPQG